MTLSVGMYLLHKKEQHDKSCDTYSICITNKYNAYKYYYVGSVTSVSHVRCDIRCVTSGTGIMIINTESHS